MITYFQSPSLLYYMTWITMGLTYFVVGGVMYLSIESGEFGRAVPNRFHPSQKMGREILLSLQTSFIMALYAPILWYLYKETTLTKIYLDIGDHGWLYFAGSIALMLLVQDVLFFLLHVIMHIRWVYPWTHKAHHQFMEPTPFGGFSFHFMEAALLISLFVVPPLLFPLHPAAIFIVQIFSIVWLVWLHSGREFSWLRPRHLDVFFSSTHHNIHHQNFKKNFGLYLSIWDKLIRAEAKS
mgnify:CR=1 FL=1